MLFLRARCRGGGMADATDLKSVDRKVVRVRLPPSAPIISITYRSLLRVLSKRVSRPFGQIWALPPSTNSSIPVTKLESSDARNKAALATSSGSPIRPIGMVDTIRAITSGDCRLASGVLIGPGLTTFERMRRSLRTKGGRPLQVDSDAIY